MLNFWRGVYTVHELEAKICYSKKVLQHQIFLKIYKYHFLPSIPNLNFIFDTALENSFQYLTQQ